jgi:hypothetical protein
MAEMDEVLAELRHRIMGQLKPAQPQHQETNGARPATTQPGNIEQRRGSAAVAVRRLVHPERDGSAVVEELAINPERDDPITPLLRPGQRVEVNTALSAVGRECPAGIAGPRRRACGGA